MYVWGWFVGAKKKEKEVFVTHVQMTRVESFDQRTKKVLFAIHFSFSLVTRLNENCLSDFFSTHVKANYRDTREIEKEKLKIF